MLGACGEEIGAVLDEERKTSREELAAEVRRLSARAASAVLFTCRLCTGSAARDTIAGPMCSWRRSVN